MKKLLLISIVGLAGYTLAQKFSEARQAGGGVSVLDMKGREIKLQEDKNGFLNDQFGRVWA